MSALGHVAERPFRGGGGKNRRRQRDEMSLRKSVRHGLEEVLRQRQTVTENAVEVDCAEGDVPVEGLHRQTAVLGDILLADLDEAAIRRQQGKAFSQSLAVEGVK